MTEIDTEQFSLRWNNFHSNLTAGFHALLEEVDLVDVTLAAGGQFVQAHKVVLSVCSPYFKQLFKVNPCKHPIVILKDVCHKELEAILQFMYQGEVNVRQEELATFLKTAEMLQIKGLTGHDTRENNSPMPTPNPMHRSVREREKIILPDPLLMKQDESHSRPYKRSRTEPPVSSVVSIPTPTPAHNPAHNPAPVDSPQSVSDDASGIEFSDTKPKSEPVDYESDVEEVVESKPNIREDPLVQLLQGESSQSHQDASQGSAAGLFASIPGLPQDSGGSQDGLQVMTSWSNAYRSVRCPFCPRVFANNPNLKTHIRDAHSALQGSVIGSVRCLFCPRVFSTTSNLKIHIRDAHSGMQGPFTCQLCGKDVKNKSCLRVHIYRRHSQPTNGTAA